MDNQNKIYTVVGATGSGKTPFIIGGQFEEGLASIFKKKNMSTLVVDEIDHPSYRNVPILHPKDYNKLNEQIGTYRTLAPLQYMKGMLKDIVYQKKVWNCLLVLEDCKKYIAQNWDYSPFELTLIGNSKQQNVDIVFMFWSWKQIPPKLFDMTKYFIIFNSGISPEVQKSNLGECYEDCQKAYDMIKRGKLNGKLPYYIVETGI